MFLHTEAFTHNQLMEVTGRVTWAWEAPEGVAAHGQTRKKISHFFYVCCFVFFVSGLLASSIGAACSVERGTTPTKSKPSKS